MTKKIMSRIVVMMMVIALILSMSIGALATGTGTDAVVQARSGVLYMELWWVDDNYNGSAVEQGLLSGSAFLIDDEYVVTNNHCVFGTEVQEYLQEQGYKSTNDMQAHLQMRVYYQGDLYRTATLVTKSDQMDFAILKLTQPIADRIPVTLRSTPAKDLEQVYALGYPGIVKLIEDFTTSSFTQEDVTVTSSTVSKAKAQNGNVEYIQHTAITSGGNSGGPLVDANGKVIGINTFVSGGDEQTAGQYGWALPITHVISALQSNNIPCKITDGTASVIEDKTEEQGDTEEGGGGNDDGDDIPEPPPAEIEVNTSALETAISKAGEVATDKLTSESATKLDDAKRAANDALNSNDQAVIDTATEKLNDVLNNGLKEKSNPLPIIIGVAVAAVVIIVIVVIVLVTKKKKAPVAEPVIAGGGFEPTPVVPVGGAPVAPITPVEDNPGTSVLDSNPGTTVLDSNPGTTVLAKPAYGALVRIATGERVELRGDKFVIGKNRKKCDFVVSNNSAISGTHMEFRYNGSQVTAVDLNSTNGSSVNGVTAKGNVAVPVKNGDKIMMADEAFDLELF